MARRPTGASTDIRRSASLSGSVDDTVRALAREAGIAVDWIDATDRPRRVAVGSLRAILDALGYPSASREDVAESRQRLDDLAHGARNFHTAILGEPIRIGSATLPPIPEPRYHPL